MNLIKPETFSSVASSATDKAMRLAVEGDLLWRHPENGSGRKLIILAHEGGPPSDTLATIGTILEEYHTEFIRSEDIDAFAQRVEREAQPA